MTLLKLLLKRLDKQLDKLLVEVAGPVSRRVQI
jgi:hypothetical protein